MKKMILLAMVTIIVCLAGCATDAMWHRGDWNREKVSWVAATHLDGDVPRTVIETKSGTIFIFQ